jgi:hypothetical protein
MGGTAARALVVITLVAAGTLVWLRLCRSRRQVRRHVSLVEEPVAASL